MRFRKAACLLAAAACIFGGAATEAAKTPAEQLTLVANQPQTWGSEGFQEDFLSGGYFAVTDLDRNGRLEVFFVSGIREDEEEIQKGRQGVIPKRDEPHALIASIPFVHRFRAYEVSADGTRLAPLAVEYTDLEVPPDLTRTYATAYNASEGIRFYNLATLTRSGETGYRVFKQVASLRDGKLTVQTIASEYGSYSIYPGQATPEAVPQGYADRYGEALDAARYAGYDQDYMAGCEPGEIRIGWLPILELSEAGDTLQGVESAFAKSWGLFSYRGK